jgi:hypothetical protein
LPGRNSGGTCCQSYRKDHAVNASVDGLL